jgi:phage/plasmid-like protein (TIGR03299 family)
MPANIDTYGKMAAFASLRQPAWHGLGTVFDKPVSTDEMLSLSHLANWNLRLRLLETDAFSDREEFEVLRDNPMMDNRVERLGIVKTRYKIFINEDIFAFADSITDDQRRWETAGSLDGGRKVFATLVSNDDLILDPNGSADVIKRYLLLTSSHDGTGHMTIKKTNTRVVCQNTLNVALRDIGDEFKIRHTQNMNARLEEARKALGFAALYDSTFEDEAKKLIEAEMNKVEFYNIIQDFYPEPDADKKAGVTRWENRIDRLMDIWNNGTGSVADLENTAWKGLQVITENNQWDRQVRKEGTENFLAAGAGFDNVTNAFRTNAFSRFLDFATA